MCELKDKGRVLRRFVEMREEEGEDVDEDIEELCGGMELGEVLEILKEEELPIKSISGIVEEVRCCEERGDNRDDQHDRDCCQLLCHF